MCRKFEEIPLIATYLGTSEVNLEDVNIDWSGTEKDIENESKDKEKV